jgi:hypothetical protein
VKLIVQGSKFLRLATNARELSGLKNGLATATDGLTAESTEHS